MRIRKEQYKKLMRAALKYFLSDDIDMYIETFGQIVCRIALKDGYLELDENKDFVFSDKGLKLIKE